MCSLYRLARVLENLGSCSWTECMREQEHFLFRLSSESLKNTAMGSGRCVWQDKALSCNWVHNTGFSNVSRELQMKAQSIFCPPLIHGANALLWKMLPNRQIFRLLLGLSIIPPAFLHRTSVHHLTGLLKILFSLSTSCLQYTTLLTLYSWMIFSQCKSEHSKALNQAHLTHSTLPGTLFP